MDTTRTRNITIGTSINHCEKIDKNSNGINEVVKGYDEKNLLLFEHFDEDENGIVEHRITYMPNGQPSLEFFYNNDLGKISKQVIYSYGDVSSTTEFSYNENGDIDTKVIYNGRGEKVKESNYSYSLDNKLTHVAVDSDGNGDIDFYEDYDEFGNCTKRSAKSIFEIAFGFLKVLFSSLFS